MFYDALGRLLGQSGDALAGFSEEAEAGLDGRDQRELRQIGVLLRRTQGVWSDVFSTLAAEVAVLEAGLEEANAALVAAGHARLEAGERQDPLGRYRDLERALDEALTFLLERMDEDWARQARRSLRAKLVEAAEIQGRLTDAMLEIR